MKVGRQVHVGGIVQGVFFRAWTKEQADRLGVAGWVRNCRDGSVEAHLAGDEAAVERLIALLRQGPPAARVERVKIGAAEPEKGDEFTVRH